MSKIALSPNIDGTGTFTIASPNSNSDRTLTLPDAAGTIQVSGNPISGTTGTFTGLVDISAAGAGQIAFPATQNASANANTLDDYEEGTWTPSVGGTATYTSQVGRYTKVGRLVHVVGALLINTIGTGSATTVSGLPFTNGASGQATVNFNYYSNSNVSTTWIAGYIEPNEAKFLFSGNDGNATTADASLSFLTNSTQIYFSATYQV
jgi:hypothetical protein